MCRPRRCLPHLDASYRFMRDAALGSDGKRIAVGDPKYRRLLVDALMLHVACPSHPEDMIVIKVCPSPPSRTCRHQVGGSVSRCSRSALRFGRFLCTATNTNSAAPGFRGCLSSPAAVPRRASTKLVELTNGVLKRN